MTLLPELCDVVQANLPLNRLNNDSNWNLSNRYMEHLSCAQRCSGLTKQVHTMSHATVVSNIEAAVKQEIEDMCYEVCNLVFLRLCAVQSL